MCATGNTPRAENCIDSVLALCETQLLALEEETQLRFERLANVAIVALDSAQSIASDTGAQRAGRINDDAQRLGDAVEDLTVEFQFFDEYAQRLQHIRKAVSMLRQQDFTQLDIDGLASQMSQVFSLHSEQRGLAECLPISRPSSNSPGSSVELF